MKHTIQAPHTLKHSIINANKILKNNQKLVLVIGDMLELGKFSEELHLKFRNSKKSITQIIGDCWFFF